MTSGPIRALALSASLAVAAFSGCGDGVTRPPTFPVQGKVIYKGAPVPTGTVTFQPDSGPPASGKIQPDGSYRLTSFAEGDGAVAGHHKVMIIANDGDPTKIPGSSPGYKVPTDLVPKKFNSIDSSGLEKTVSKENKDYDFDLK